MQSRPLELRDLPIEILIITARFMDDKSLSYIDVSCRFFHEKYSEELNKRKKIRYLTEHVRYIEEKHAVVEADQKKVAAGELHPYHVDDKHCQIYNDVHRRLLHVIFISKLYGIEGLQLDQSLRLKMESITHDYGKLFHPLTKKDLATIDAEIEKQKPLTSPAQTSCCVIL